MQLEIIYKILEMLYKKEGKKIDKSPGGP